MKIFVTGGAGFIGSNFIRHVLSLSRGHQVVNYDKLTYASNLANLAEVAENPRYSFVRCDICDGVAVEEAMRGCDAVIHFAAESHVDRSIYEPAPVIETNVTGTFIQGRFGSSVHRRPARVRVARTSQPIFAWARPLLVSGRACCFPQRLTIKSIFPLGSREASSR